MDAFRTICIAPQLVNSAGAMDLTLVAAGDDWTDGTFKNTVPVIVGCQGVSELLAVVETALDGTGTKTHSEVLVKFT